MKKIFLAMAMVALIGTTVEAFDLTGDWGAEGADLYIRQVNDTVWWYIEDTAENPTWTSVAYGIIENNNTVNVTWAGVPKGNLSLMGTAVLNVTSTDELRIVDQTGGFGGEYWQQVVFTRINSGF